MSYATTDELFRLLRISSPTPDQLVAGQRVLDAASGEVDNHVDRTGTDPALTGWQLALASEVALERAVEHWQQGQSPFGVVGFGSDVPVVTGQNSWRRHASKLQPLKHSWGVA